MSKIEAGISIMTIATFLLRHTLDLICEFCICDALEVSSLPSQVESICKAAQMIEHHGILHVFGTE